MGSQTGEAQSAPAEPQATLSITGRQGRLSLEDGAFVHRRRSGLRNHEDRLVARNVSGIQIKRVGTNAPIVLAIATVVAVILLATNGQGGAAGAVFLVGAVAVGISFSRAKTLILISSAGSEGIKFVSRPFNRREADEFLQAANASLAAL
jgi:hypothetical protein